MGPRRPPSQPKSASGKRGSSHGVYPNSRRRVVASRSGRTTGKTTRKRKRKKKKKKEVEAPKVYPPLEPSFARVKTPPPTPPPEAKPMWPVPAPPDRILHFGIDLFQGLRKEESQSRRQAAEEKVQKQQQEAEQRRRQSRQRRKSGRRGDPLASTTNTLKAKGSRRSLPDEWYSARTLQLEAEAQPYSNPMTEPPGGKESWEVRCCIRLDVSCLLADDGVVFPPYCLCLT